MSLAAGSVLERLGVRLRPLTGGLDATELLGLALRRNPRRAQLLVSRVLGKHVPTDPRLVRATGLLLGGLVADALAGRPPRALPAELVYAAIRGGSGAAAALHAACSPALDAPNALVLGFAETATALGHCVAEGLGGTDYLHSTRRTVPGVAPAGGFAEEHSHATAHLLLPTDPTLLRDRRPLVLVDDELSTGRTVYNTIAALHRVTPRERYVVAALVDVRPPDSGLVDAVVSLGARLDVVSLARAAIEVPPDVAERAERIRTGLDAAHDANPTVGTPDGDTPDGEIRHGGTRHGGTRRTQTPTRTHADPDSRVELGALGWPAGLPVGGRHGFSPDDHRALAAVLPGIGAELARVTGLGAGGRTLVLGTEELMALPLRLAQVLADAGHDVRFSTTTRSPAVVLDTQATDGMNYALSSGIAFPAHDDPADGPGPRFAYNLGGRAHPAWDRILVVVDPPADTPALRTGLLAALAPHTRRTILVVTP